MEIPKFTDFLVTSATGGVLNPEGLDNTLHQMGASLIKPPGQDYTQEGGCYVMRVFGDPGFLKFACEHQGYCKIVGPRGHIEPQATVLDEVTESVEYFYTNVATAFAARINEIFTSEDTLKACFEKHFKMLPFDRTNYWSGILFKELDACWREHGPEKLAGLTSHDRFEILDTLSDFLDFNLYSQVALNLQNWSLISYQSGDVEKQLDTIRKKWEKFSSTPLDPNAKMVKEAFRPQDTEWNKDLSTVKSLKTISGITPNISFRVSPKGSTPAFADTQNFSTIGIGGDQYVKAAQGHTVWYVCWKSAPYILLPAGDGFTTPGIFYSFRSKSGGDILNTTLFARGLAVAFWTGLGLGTLCVPRMGSVMVVTSQGETEVKKIFADLSSNYPMLELHKDKRQYEAVPTQSRG